MPFPPRVTIRCAIEDLGLESWDESGPISGSVNDVNHPIVRNAVSRFPDDRDDTETPETVSTVSPPCFKIKSGRWRGAAYRDSQQQVWIVAAGLRKGRERKDFYQAFMTMHKAGGHGSWAPTDADRRLLERDQAGLELRKWEREIWAQLSQHFQDVGLEHPFIKEVRAPFTEPGVAPFIEVRVELIKFEDEIEPLGIEVNVKTLDWAQREPWERLALYAILCRIHAGEQEWSISPGRDASVLATLEFDEDITASGVIDGIYQSEPPVNFNPGTKTHLISHSQAARLTECTVNANSIRALCGQIFVPRQDFKKFPQCPDCEMIKSALQSAINDRKRTE